MRVVRTLFAFVILAGLITPAVTGQDKSARDKEQPGKLRGQLPPNYGKLGLSEEQKQKVYEVRDRFGGKIGDLRKQIAELQEQERKDMEKVLTDAQRARLREIIASKAPGDGKDKPKPP